MTFIILLIVAIAVALFYAWGNNEYNKTREDLEMKYSSLVSQLLSSHERIRILTKKNNMLVIGVVSMGGKTLFTIKEQPNGEKIDEVSIVYSIKDSPIVKNFDLSFVFSEQQCLYDFRNVLKKINERIKDDIISKGL